MPMITKAATPLRIPRYLTPNTTWYKKRAMRQLSPMLASPKKVRKTVKRKQRHLSPLGLSQTLHTDQYKGSYQWGPTREGGEDEDEQRDAGAADDGQHHVVVERVSHLVVKELRAAVQNLHLTGAREEERDRDLTSAAETVVDIMYCSGRDFRASNWWGASIHGGLSSPLTFRRSQLLGPDLVDCLARRSAYCTTKSLKRARCSSARSWRE